LRIRQVVNDALTSLDGDFGSTFDCAGALGPGEPAQDPVFNPLSAAVD